MKSVKDIPQLFRRCLECPPDIPSCPTCPDGQTCVLQSRSCEACPSARCVNPGTLPGQPEPKKASSTPAIAGGVAGGVLFIIIITFLVWWFCIRRRRREWDEQVWQPETTDQTVTGLEKRDLTGLNREARESTRSMGSIASTVRTRASNVIQIAYIPGVTNRSPSQSPGLLAPPVPPVPAGSTSDSTPQSPTVDQDRRFFTPDDLRNSTYSDTSGRQSLSPSLARASNATALYRSHAQVFPRPAQQALRAKAAVVNVNKLGSPSDSAPAADPAAPSPKPQNTKGIMNSPIVARNVTARPIQVKKSNSTKKGQIPTLANLQAAATNSRVPHDTPVETAEQRTGDRSEDEAEASSQLITNIRSAHQSAAATIIDDTPALKQSHFTDSSSASSSSDVASFVPARSRTSTHQHSPLGSTTSLHSRSGSRSHPQHQKSGSLNSLIEEAMTRAAREPKHGGLGSITEGENQNPIRSHPLSQGLEHRERSGSAAGSSPFSDSNEVRDSSSRAS